MPDARDDILARIRTALTDRPAPPPVARDYNGAGANPLAPTPLLELLEERLVDYRAVVTRAAPHEIVEAVSAIVTKHDATRVLVPDGFPAEWAPREKVADDPPLTPAELDRLDGVLTTCRVAIAETGTIVLDGGEGQGRRAVSLVPDLHVVVVRATDVVRNVPDALPRLDARTPQTWISGPSATSDIELDRVEGVHGPRRLEVVLEIRG